MPQSGQGGQLLSDGPALYTPGLSENRGGTSAYYSNDRLGNLWTLDGSSKSLLAYEDTSGFGAPTYTGSGSGSASPLKYGGANGCQTDGDTGLVLMGHRYYDTRIGRFISQDPAKAGGNWYAYAGNNPVNNIDPTGLYIENPEPDTDQTEAHNVFASAFYGNQSGLSSFFDQEAQSEQRGAAGYAASVAIGNASITGDGNFGTEVQGLLKQIATTNFGANLLAQFTWDPHKLNITEIYNSPASVSFVGQAYVNGVFYLNTILFETDLNVAGYTTEGFDSVKSFL